MKCFVAAVALLALSGCAVSIDSSGLHITGPQHRGLSLDQIREISAADLRAADAKAIKSGDRPGQWCWEYLMPVVSPEGSTIGVAETIETSRIVAMAAAGPCGGILQPLIAEAGAL